MMRLCVMEGALPELGTPGWDTYSPASLSIWSVRRGGHDRKYQIEQIVQQRTPPPMVALADVAAENDIDIDQRPRFD